MPFQNRAGLYRHRITVTTESDTKTSTGGFTPTPVTLATRTAGAVSPLSGMELIRAQQINPRARIQVTLRYRPSLRIPPGAIVIYHASAGDQRLEVLYVQDVQEYHHEYQLLCAEAITR